MKPGFWGCGCAVARLNYPVHASGCRGWGAYPQDPGSAARASEQARDGQRKSVCEKGKEREKERERERRISSTCLPRSEVGAPPQDPTESLFIWPYDGAGVLGGGATHQMQVHACFFDCRAVLVGVRLTNAGFPQDSGAEARRLLRGNSGCRVACCVFRVSRNSRGGGGEAHLAAVASAFSLTDSGLRT